MLLHASHPPCQKDFSTKAQVFILHGGRIRRPLAFAGSCVHRRLLDACQASLRAERSGGCAPPRNVRAELALLCGACVGARSRHVPGASWQLLWL